MKIAYLSAGAGGMFCGTCLHDNTLAAAMLASGEDVLLVPTYTPLRTDEENVSQPLVRFGGINLYLQDKIPLFRHTPAFVDRWFDSPRLMRWLGKREFAVAPEKLGGLTVSMLEGERGSLRKEVNRLADWLAEDVRPDVVHLSNAMMIGLAREIKRRTGAPVIASLSGEDVFLDRLIHPHRERARDQSRERAVDVDHFVAMNHYYAAAMSEYLQVPLARIEVIPHGLRLVGHGTRREEPGAAEFTIGYFARITPDKGLHHLVDALRPLAEDASLPRVRLAVAGYLAPNERPYLDEQLKKLRSWGLADRFDYRGELSRSDKIAFLQSLDVMCLPTVYRESKGLSVLEALANGVPVVVPDHGTFPEMMADTGGGVLHKPDDPLDVARAIRQLIVDPVRRGDLGHAGQQAIHARYSDQVMAERTVALYRRVIASHETRTHVHHPTPR